MGTWASRGGFTCKIHLSADGRCRPSSLVVTPGQRADCTQFKPVLEKIRVPRVGPGRPRKKPDSLAADKAYSDGPCREYLRRRASGTPSRRRPKATPPAYAKAHTADGHPASTKRRRRGGDQQSTVPDMSATLRHATGGSPARSGASSTL